MWWERDDGDGTPWNWKINKKPVRIRIPRLAVYAVRVCKMMTATVIKSEGVVWQVHKCMYTQSIMNVLDDFPRRTHALGTHVSHIVHIIPAINACKSTYPHICHSLSQYNLLLNRDLWFIHRRHMIVLEHRARELWGGGGRESGEILSSTLFVHFHKHLNNDLLESKAARKKWKLIK